MKILEWLVLLPLWRRLIQSPSGRVAAAAGTAIVWIVLIILIAVSGGGDDDTDETVQDQGAPEPAITATVEAEPTEEAAEATATTPPDEPGTDDLAAELAYLASLGTLTVDMSLLLDNVVALSTEAANDPTVLFGEEWFQGLQGEQDRLNTAQSTFLALQPPTQFAETHRLMTQALNEMDIALDLFEVGGRDFDAAKLSEAADHMGESTRFINEATAALPE